MYLAFLTNEKKHQTSAEFGIKFKLDIGTYYNGTITLFIH